MLTISIITLLALAGCQKDLPPQEKLALFKAVEGGDALALKKALQRGISPNIHDSELGYLIAAATRSGNDELLKILIDAGADVNAKTDEGEVPLVDALLEGDRCRAAVLLLAAGANPNEKFTHAAEAAIGPEYQDKSVRELYQLYKQEYPGQWEKKKECWLEVERLMK